MDSGNLLSLLQDMAERSSTCLGSMRTRPGKAWNPVKAESGMLALDKAGQSEKALYMMLETESGMTTSVISEHPWKDSLPMTLT